MGQWASKWKVSSFSTPAKIYTVSEDTEGNFGCSCPVWKFRRLQCKHIDSIRYMMDFQPTPEIEFIIEQIEQYA